MPDWTPEKAALLRGMLSGLVCVYCAKPKATDAEWDRSHGEYPDGKAWEYAYCWAEGDGTFCMPEGHEHETGIPMGVFVLMSQVAEIERLTATDRICTDPDPASHDLTDADRDLLP